MTFGHVLESIIIIFFMVCYFMILFWILSDLFRSHDLNGWVKALWILGLFAIPFLTALLYMLIRGSGMSERAMKSAAQQREQTVAYAKQIAAQEGGTGSATDQIAQAKSLLDSGAINQQEFEALKAKALG